MAEQLLNSSHHFPNGVLFQLDAWAPVVARFLVSNSSDFVIVAGLVL